jgi:hypothetical protein
MLGRDAVFVMCRWPRHADALTCRQQIFDVEKDVRLPKG